MKENEHWLPTVIEMARLLGWYCCHFRASMNQRGQWSTAVQGDGKGFPDLFLISEAQGRVILAELKSEKGRLSPEQILWGEILKHSPCVEYYVWRPSDDVERVLKGV